MRNFRLSSQVGPDLRAGRSVARAQSKLHLRAFTIIEVLVALMIFALCSLVLAGAYLNVLNSYQAAERANLSTENLAFARSQLLAEPDRAKAELGAEFDAPDNRHVRWTATIEAASLPDLFTVTFVCEISEAGGAAEPSKTTQTFTVLRPTWSEAVENGVLKQSVQDRIAEIQGKKP